MKDPGSLPEQNETPDDVATLYTWANLHGAKYRDFSASRAQTREAARLRVEDAMKQERLLAEGQPLQPVVGSAQILSAEKPEDERLAEARRVFEAELAAEEEHRRHLFEEQASRVVARTPEVSEAPAVTHVPIVTQAPTGPHAPQVEAYPKPLAIPLAASQSLREPQSLGRPLTSSAGPSLAYVPAPAHRASWEAPSAPETPVRPDWLTTPSVDLSAKSVHPAPEGTLQGSRERLASRWFALKGVFDGAKLPSEAPAAASSRAPVLAVFSLAGGVGKTSLVATLGRALSERGERVLLVDTSSYSLLPFYFGAHEQRPRVLRTFSPPGPGGDSPILMLSLDPEAMGPESANGEPLAQEIARHSAGVNRVIVDLATASGATSRRILRLSPVILVPIVPDMNSVVSVGAIDAFFQHSGNGHEANALPHYVLNQFDAALPLHLDVREILRQQLGDRLLPFALRRTAVVSDALAEGMTVMDYAPSSTAAEDFNQLAGWLKSLAAPASPAFRGVRWSER